MTVVVAAFDVDGTLTRRDCVRPFLTEVCGTTGLLRTFARRPLATLRAGAARDRDRLKDVVVGGALGGRKVADVDAAGERFATVIQRDLLRPDTVARLRWHQAADHRTVLVSASLRSYLEPLARLLGVEAVLCTDAARRDGRYLHHLEGANCRAGEKATRLRRWLTEQGHPDADVWAYGDSDGDRELLALADHPTWVRGTIVPAIPAGFDS